MRLGTAAGHRYVNVAHALTRHAFRRVDGRADGIFDRLHVDHRARPHSPRRLMADADDAKPAVRIGARDKATHLRGAHVERGHE